MGSASLRPAAAASPAWDGAAQAMYRAAQAVSHAGGPQLMHELVRELAELLPAAAVFVAVFEDASRTTMRTLAAMLDGEPLRNFDYPLAGSPCAKVVGQSFRYVERGVAAEFPPGTMFAAKGMDAYAAFPLNDSAGRPLGLLVAMDRRPIADAVLAEALLKIFAGRIVAEIERGRADEALRAAALAVSSAHGDSVFAELVRYLATILQVEVAFVARQDPQDPQSMRVLAMHCDGQILRDVCYPLQGTPCATVFGQRFRAYASRLRELFPHDPEAQLQATESYAGMPLTDTGGAPLGLIAVASRRPLVHVERIESMLQIFAVRAAAELEQLRATAALRRSEASYRAIFETTEDAIFVHDWDTGAIIDANPKACANYGYSRDELLRLSVGELSSGEPPYTQEQALRNIGSAKLGRCPPFEWHRRSRDGSLHWDEVLLKPLHIDGRPHILAITREITQHKAALAALRAREEQYRAIFDGSADSMGLWSEDLVLADVNQAFTRLSGWTRDEVIGRRLDERAGEPDAAQRIDLIRGALAGREGRIEARVPGKDGPAYDVEIRYVPVSFGGRAYALSVARDITERNVALAALRAQEQKYRAIFDGTVDSMVLWDRTLRVVDVNDAFVRMTGLAREQVIGRHWRERPDADDLPQMLGLIEGALAGRAAGATLEVSRADGSRFDIELRYLPVRFGDEAFALGVGRDVSERLENERRLRDSEEQYRSIFNASADALVLRDADFRIVDVNATYERMSGWTRDEVLGLDRIVANPAELAPAIRAQHARALGGEPIEMQVPLLRRDGLRHDIELRGMPVRHRGAPHVLYMGRDVTERKRAEAALRASEQQYRAIFDASIDALILWNSRYQRVDVNPAFERIFGWSRDEVLGKGYDQPSSRTLPRRELVRRALAGEACSAELDIARKDGTRVHIEVHVVPFQHLGEAHALAIVRDITERKTAEARLRASEEQYREIFNASADALMLWNGRLQRVDVNPAHEKIFGFRRDEVVGRGFEGLPYPEEFARPRLEAVRRALAGEASRAELEAIRKDGQRIVTELRTVPFTQRGEPLVLQIARDITDSRTAEARLRASEEQYRAIFDASIDALILWNSRYQRVDVNPAYERIFGWSRDEVVGQGVDGPSPDPDPVHTRRELVQRALAGEACSAEREALRKDGTRILVEVHAIPFRHRGEAHVLAIARDITERRAAEDQREQLEAQLRQAQKMEAIGQLTGGIAHDFNNILTSVIGYLVLGQERAGTLGDERLQRQLDKAQLAAQRARELIAQMLAFARRQRGERRVLPLAPLVRQTLQLLRSTLPTSVAVNAVLSGDDAGVRVDADAVQLEQVLFNLCLNARDAIGESGLIEVRLGACSGAYTCASCRAQLPAAGWVELSVADNGSGIAADTLERIFEPFFSTKEVGRGSGMGLAMVHGIVHDHGGHVLVETAPQAGSVFRVLLPPARADARPEAPAPALAVAGRPLAGRVMVVDDEAMVGDFMAELLEGWGLRVVLQRDPLQALAWLEQPDQPLDLLITDQTMPRCSGLQLARRAGSLRPGLPVLLYTGNAEGIDADEARRHGVCGVLHKPVDAEALRSLIRRCLHKADSTPA